jgi:hypothetical protein
MLRSNWNDQQSSLFWRELECTGRRISRTPKAGSDSPEGESPGVQSSPPTPLSLTPGSAANAETDSGP